MERIIFPSPLIKGDKIAIISPASHILPEYVDGACRTITQLGFLPVVGAHCKGQCGGYSGSIEQRLADFNDALHNPEVKAILCSRGGYGVVHLLEYLSPDDIAENAKWLIGFSDISALHAAMAASGVASIHASMAKHLTKFGADNEATQALFGILQGQLPTYRIPAHPFNRPGTVTGTLTGGNMAVLCGLLDTEFDLLSRGDILFIEDVGEEVYKIERMLYNLRLSGVCSLPHDWKPNPEGGRPLMVEAGKPEIIKAEAVFLAMGFLKPQQPEFADNVFVAGDAANGASLVVRAMASGRKIAAQVDKYLNK